MKLSIQVPGRKCVAGLIQCPDCITSFLIGERTVKMEIFIKFSVFVL